MICETQFFWGGRGGGASLFPTSVRRYPSVFLGGVKKIQSNDPAKDRTSLSEFYCLKASKCMVCWLFCIFCRCNSLYGTPTMFIDVLNHPMLEKFDVSSLRTGQEVVILVRRCCCTVNASDL